MSIVLEFLPKRGGARFKNVDTYKVLCDDPKNFVGIKSFKAGEEVGSGVKEFVHVLLSKIPSQEKVVLKVHRADNPFIDREIRVMESLQKYRNIVQYVCVFDCKSDIVKLMKPIDKRINNICTEDGVPIKCIVMEYIHDGNIEKYLGTSDMKILKSLFIQTILVVAELGSIYKIFQGDINSGNILVKKTKRDMLRYEVFDKVYTVHTEGIMPVLIDFGRGGFYDRQTKNKRLIIDDILIVLMLFSNYVKLASLKETIKCIVAKYEKSRDIMGLIEDIQAMF